MVGGITNPILTKIVIGVMADPGVISDIEGLIFDIW